MMIIKDSSSAMIDKVEQELGEPLKEVSADAGYSNEKDLKKLEERNIDEYLATRKEINEGNNPATARMKKSYKQTQTEDEKEYINKELTQER